MSAHTLIVYSGIYALAIVMPGPGIMAIIARALHGGVGAAAPAILGNTLGDLILMSLSVLGLAVVAREMGEMFLVFKLAGAGYLVYLGYRYWTMPVEAIAAIRPNARRGFWSQLAITLGNPKAIAMFMALLPSVVDLNAINSTGYFQLCLCTLVLIPTIEVGYAILAAQVRSIFASAAARRKMNRGAGAIMIGAGVGVAVS